MKNTSKFGKISVTSIPTYLILLSKIFVEGRKKVTVNSKFLKEL